MFDSLEDHISQQEAEQILHLSEEEWRASIEAGNGTTYPCSLAGVVIQLEWSNPESVVIPHFWMDEKLRGEGLGSTLTDELINQLRSDGSRGTLFITAQASGGKTRGLLKKYGFTDVYTCEKEAFDEAVIEGRLEL